MLQIENTIVSLDVIDEMFLCDLSACKGICCVEGDSGAPVENDEVAELEKVLPHVWDDLSQKAKDIIKKQGVVYIDEDGEYVTSIVDGKDCVFTCYDEQGICKCAIEKAFREKRVDFYKPISCHLYPIRVSNYREFKAVNYHRWSICKPAIACGKINDLKVFQFLKEPLIRKFGEDWYEQLSSAAELLENENA